MAIRTKKRLKDQSSAALLVALIMIVVLTLIGLASTFTSTFEIKLSGNKRSSTNAFYTAEGGTQSVLVNLGNFNVPGSFTAVATGALPVDLQNESIDLRLPSPTLSLPNGVSFADPPRVTVYHTTKTGAPRGSGFSATGNYEYGYFIIDSIGKDQTEIALIKSNCEVREKVVRLFPPTQGGN